MFGMGMRKQENANRASLPDDLQQLADQVDGEGHTPGESTYDLRFLPADDGEQTLTMSANDDRGGTWGVLSGRSIEQFRQSLLDWRELLQLEHTYLNYPAEVIASAARRDPEQYLRIQELRERLWAEDPGGIEIPGVAEGKQLDAIEAAATEHLFDDLIKFREQNQDEDDVLIREGLQLGVHVHLDEDLAAEATGEPRVYVFEAFDSTAPQDSNCTITTGVGASVDVQGDWRVRGRHRRLDSARHRRAGSR